MLSFLGTNPANSPYKAHPRMAEKYATAAMMPCNPSREAAAFAPTVFSFVEFVSANTQAFNVAKDSRASMFGFKYSEV